MVLPSTDTFNSGDAKACLHTNSPYSINGTFSNTLATQADLTKLH